MQRLTFEERCQFVLAAAGTLFANGQSTAKVIDTAGRLAHELDLPARILVRWGEVQVQVDGRDGRSFSQEVTPKEFHMKRVADSSRAIFEVEAGRLAPEVGALALRGIARLPPSPTWLFALAAGAGATALAVILGVEPFAAAGLVLLSAVAGALLRRLLVYWSASVLLHTFCAAFLAGAVAGWATHQGLGAALSWLAVCPCMMLVPGPHFLNSALDLVTDRIPLGATRLIYALLIMLAICAGLFLALALLGAPLAVAPVERKIPLIADVLAAGTAVFAYCIFYATPLRMLPWPMAIGVLAHAVHWIAASALGLPSALGTLLACLLVGTILTPIAHRHHMPFAVIGFAAVASLIPSIHIFRSAGALAQIALDPRSVEDLLGVAVANGIWALVIILTMTVGIIFPKLFIEEMWERRRGQAPP